MLANFNADALFYYILENVSSPSEPPVLCRAKLNEITPLEKSTL